ncbi:exodeoxyribonuclease VII large subunit [Phascolarctobacterium faecium]|uniref:exodeoxyribonuclease VII large subunit n=1 Tax=Phascolarctobacterium faecium TaxID=33025 RepID=UPI0030797B01
MNEVIYSVSELNLMIKSLLEGDRTFTNIQIQGEISNFKRYSSGHCYFTLKDAGGVLKAVMFRNQARSLRFEPQNGDTVVAIGRVGVYERDGVYQLYTDLLLPLGAGDLMLAYEELKKKLTEEGLFDSERKRELPLNPKTVGMITSPSGAAVRDMITVARRRNRGIKLLLFPVKVQGDGSAAEIVRAIRFMNKHRLADVLIVGRGGGSIEELWAFNEEPVVRAIAASEIPVVSAVGHETDFTLSDFAADSRAATPSQAAELVVADADSYLRYVEELTARGERVLVHQLEQAQHKLQRLQGSWALAKPERWLEPLQQRTDMAMRQLQGRMESILQKRQHKFGLLAARLEALSPLTVLARGYSITKTDSGRALRSIADVRWGEELRTQVADGDVISVVQQVERREKQ